MPLLHTGVASCAAGLDYVAVCTAVRMQTPGASCRLVHRQGDLSSRRCGTVVSPHKCSKLHAEPTELCAVTELEACMGPLTQGPRLPTPRSAPRRCQAAFARLDACMEKHSEG